MLERQVPRQEGAALIVGLVLLLVMTLLGVAGMNTSTLELVMAGNTQDHQQAFQAAESAIEAELMRGPSDRTIARITPDYVFGAGTSASTTTSFQSTRLPPTGYSLTEYRADHFLINSVGNSNREASSNHLQGFFVVIPGGL